MYREDFSLAALPEGLRKLYFAWSASQRDGREGCIESLELTMLAQRVDRLVLTEAILNDALEIEDFRFLYVGSAFGKEMTSPVTGRRLSELDGKGPDSQMWAAYSALMQHRKPLFVSLPFVGEASACQRTQELFLPVKDYKRQHHYMLNGVVLRDPPQSVLVQ